MSVLSATKTKKADGYRASASFNLSKGLVGLLHRDELDLNHGRAGQCANLERSAGGLVGLIGGAEILEPGLVHAREVHLTCGRIGRQEDMGLDHVTKSEAQLGQLAFEVFQGSGGLFFGV